MEQKKMRIELMPHTPFLKEDGTFDLERAINYSGKIAGVCYNKEGFSALKDEPVETTNKRVNLTLNNEHHSVYDHINIGLDLGEIPKILAMLLNNEKQYNTSEKSARYTPVERVDGSVISKEEEELYNKWMNIFRTKIKNQYGYIYNDSKIEKLAQENSRYLVTVFMPTQMIYTVPLGQLNRIVAFMTKIINDPNKDEFKAKLVPYFQEFIHLLDRVNVLEAKLQTNRKDRNFSLFSEEERKESFGDSYCTNYVGSFAELAQAQRHRTLDYEMKLFDKKEYFVPPILLDDEMLVQEWLKDIKSVGHVNPQGELIAINERGTYENFILKAKERLCSAAQLEICNQTKETLLKYKAALEEINHPFKDDISKYSKGARCTFKDFECTSDCKFPEGKVLTRKI